MNREEQYRNEISDTHVENVYVQSFALNIEEVYNHSLLTLKSRLSYLIRD